MTYRPTRNEKSDHKKSSPVMFLVLDQHSRYLEGERFMSNKLTSFPLEPDCCQECSEVCANPFLTFSYISTTILWMFRRSTSICDLYHRRFSFSIVVANSDRSRFHKNIRISPVIIVIAIATNAAFPKASRCCSLDIGG